MKIGTPLSSTATKIMLLGSGELGKEVIIALQRYGAEVIAVDRYENAPGHQVAHKSFAINMADAKELKDLILQERPHIIVPEIEAIATEVLQEIESENIAEVIPTAKAARLTMNREGIRRLSAEELKLPVSRYEFCSSFEELKTAVDEKIHFPCIVKPVMSSSGKGQSYVGGTEALKKAWDYAMEAGRVSHGRVIVEEVITFDFEITLLTVRSIGTDGKIETSFCEPIGHIQEEGDYIESWQPQPMPIHALKEAKRIAKAVTDSLGGRGVFGVEMFIKDDQVYFSEVSPRPHDTGMVTMV
ncbi:MAG: formate-dependent phosphoribosylglycinamide formyltransferase, partial [Spirochaetia bacterium]|nr:formate-dependent phosphoribosylglycinamide formyltransferase [Spirochaetia bacterium]